MHTLCREASLWLSPPEGLMPKGGRELEFRLQPIVERSSFRLAFLFPDVIGAYRDFGFRWFRSSVGHRFLVAPELSQDIARSS